MYARAWAANKRPGEAWHKREEDDRFKLLAEATARDINVVNAQGGIRLVESLDDKVDLLCFSYQSATMSAPGFYYYMAEKA